MRQMWLSMACPDMLMHTSHCCAIGLDDYEQDAWMAGICFKE